MGQIIKVLHELKPAMLMVVVQVVSDGFNVLYKLVTNDGTNLRVVVAYRMLFTTAFMVPLALIVERGSLAQNLYIESLALTSATFVCAMVNVTRAVTFIIAITLGLEKLAFRTMAGKAKVLGTVSGIGGAMLLTLYKGPQFNISTHIDLLPHGHNGSNTSHAPHTHHLLGAFLFFLCNFCYATWMNIQAKMSENYPCHYSSTALGVLGMGLTFCLIAWCVGIKGPFYTSNFGPLVLVLVALAGSLFLQENSYLGR
ncbi:WAT1-related protein [Hibiscus syriacus]|uniref:WAT1-related protein n=1 Tax=Hibiscus syriacus TaxID=106335 RepID=A0A6A2XGT5_HIBSY|nr:WAT1-related protein [Hibiscus syriacus]